MLIFHRQNKSILLVMLLGSIFLASLAVSADGETPFEAGLRHYLGRDGTVRNYPEAIRLLQQAADGGNGRAKAILADMYARGMAVAKNNSKALELARGASDQDDLFGQYLLARYSLANAFYVSRTNRSKKLDDKRAEDLLTKLGPLLEAAAGRGDPLAQFAIAEIYGNGDGRPKDFQKALDWYTLSADQGYAGAQLALGCYHRFNVFQPPHIQRRYRIKKEEEQQKTETPSDSKALGFFHRAALADIGFAQAELGYMLIKGRGTTADSSRAIAWLERAAAKADAWARVCLADIYLAGGGVPKDLERAVTWYIQALKNDNDRRADRIVMQAITGIGKPAVPIILRELDEIPKAAYRFLFRFLARTDSQPALHYLMGVVENRTEGFTVRKEALMALGRPSADNLVPRLIQLADRPAAKKTGSKRGGYLEDMVVYVLGDIGSPEAAHYLLDQLGLANEKRSAALSALAKMKHPDVLPHLIQDLNDPQKRAAAIERLLAFPAATISPPLLAALKSQDPSFRTGAALAIAELKPGRMAEDLQEMIAGPDDDLRIHAALALSALDTKYRVPDMVPLLGLALADPDRRIRLKAALALQEMESPEAVDAILSALDRAYLQKDSVPGETDRKPVFIRKKGKRRRIKKTHPKYGEIKALIKALSYSVSPETAQAIEHLARALQSSDKEVRSMAVEGLYAIGTPETHPPLLQALDDRDESIREYALSRMSILSASIPAAALSKALYSPGLSMRREALAAMWVQNTDPGDIARELSPLLESENPTQRSNALRALRQIGPPYSTGPIKRLVGDEDPAVRKSALEAVERAGDTACLSAVINALTDEVPEVRDAALEALVALDAPAAIAHLVTALEDLRPEARRNAVDELGEIGALEAFPVVAKLVEDPDPDIREKALEALAWIHSEKAAPIIIRVLSDPEEDVRKAALEALNYAGTPQTLRASKDTLANSGWDKTYIQMLLARVDPGQAYLYLSAVLAHPDGDIREQAVEIISESGDRQAIGQLIALLQDPDSGVRREAAAALGKLAGRESIPALKKMSRDQARPDQEAALEALGKIGDTEIPPQLARQLLDANDRERARAVGKLKHINSPEATRFLIKALDDKSKRVRGSAIEALGKRGAVAAIPKLELLLVNDRELRWEVSQAFKKIDHPDAAAALARTLTHTNSSIRYRAGVALISDKARFAVPELMQLLKSKRRIEREIAALALAEAGSPTAVPALVHTLREDEWTVAIKAAAALGTIGDSTAVPALMEALQSKNGFIRAVAAEALGRLQAREAVPHLVAALQDRSKYVVATSAVALGRMGRTEAAEYLLHPAKAGLYQVYGELARDWENNDFIDALGGPLFRQLTLEQVKSAAGRAITDGRYQREKTLGYVPLFLERQNYSFNLAAFVNFIGRSPVYRLRLSLLGGIYYRGTDMDDVSDQSLKSDLDTLQRSLPEYAAHHNPYHLFFNAYLLNEKGLHQPALAWSQQALDAITASGDPALQICIRWLRAEVLWQTDRAAEALNEISRIEQSLLPRISLMDRFLSGLFFSAQTEALKGILQASVGNTQQAVMTLHQAAIRLEHEFGGETPTRRMERMKRRLQKIILAYRAQAQGEALKKDADAVIALTTEAEAQTVMERSAEDVALTARITAAIGDGEYETAHKLTEKLYLKRQARLTMRDLRVGSAAKRQTLNQIKAIKDAIVELDQAIDTARERMQQKKGWSKRQGSHSRQGHAAMRSNLPGASMEPASLDPDELMKQRRAKQRELKKFMVSLKKTHPEIATLIGAEPVRVGRLQRSLADHQVIVQYLVLDEQTYLFVITTDDIQILETAAGRNRIADNVRRLRRQIQRNSYVRGKPLARAPAAAKPADTELSRLLLEPLREILASFGHVIIIPNGDLHFLPFGALKIGNQYLAKRFTVSYLSASSLFALSNRPSAEKKKLYALANPIHPDWTALRGAEEEVKSISAHFQEKQIFAREDARKSVLQDRDLRGWHLHLSMHGSAGEVAQTGLVLSDGYLTVPEIWGLYLDGAPLVVLSACETHLGERVSGDEVVSMANGFIFSGALSVVSSLWKVPDEATRHLMEKFYNYLSDGSPRAEALTLAQRDMIKDERWSQPYFWAGFVLNGF